MFTNSKYLLILLINLPQVFAYDWENIQLPDYIKASNTDSDDRFGTAVAVSGNTMVIGAPREDSNSIEADNSHSNSGAAYVFIMTVNGWQQQAYLKASNLDIDDGFGTSVAIDGDTIVVGSIGESSNANGINGNQSNNSSLNSGAAYVFVRNAGTWSQQAYIKASNSNAEDLFGMAVAIEDETLVVGAIGESNNEGAAYVFFRSNNSWTQQAYIKASNSDSDDQFGVSVSVSGDTIAIGANGEMSNATSINGNQSNNSLNLAGAAYIFSRVANSWSQQAYIKASNTAGGDEFGQSVAIDGDNLVVGAWGEDTDFMGNSASFAGAAYAFSRTNDVWSQSIILKGHNTDTSDSFGWSVDINEHNIIVSANGEDSSATNINGNGDDNSINNSGAAYIFSCESGIWVQKAYLKASNTGFFDEFGYSVSISEGLIAIGAYREGSNSTGIGGNQNNNSAGNSGATYTFIDDIIFKNSFETSACVPTP